MRFRCASGAPPVRLRCASAAPPLRLRCVSAASCFSHSLVTLRIRRRVRAARLSLATVAVVVDAPQPQPPVCDQPMTVVMRAFRLCSGGNTERLRR